MSIRSFFTFSSLAGILLLLLSATDATAQRYSGRATAIKSTVGIPLTDPLTTAVNDTGELPSGGGDISLVSNSTNILSGTLTAGASSSRTRAGSLGGIPNASHSEASVANLNFSVLGNLITATAVSTMTDCSCPTGTCTGSTTITGLTLNGNPVVVTGGNVTQTISLQLGGVGAIVGTLVINEQINSSGSKTVNGLHIRVTDSITGIVTDVVIASSHSDIICAPAPTANFYSGRAYGIGSTVTVNDLILNTSSSVATIVADTGPLPASGGSIGPVVVAGANIPNVATSGTLTTNTSGGIFGGITRSDSSANVQNLSATVAGFVITATVLTSDTHCTCAQGGATSTCTGSSQVTSLLITTPLNGTITGTVTGAPNEVVELRVSGVLVATLIFNEQIPASPTATGSITVNALHIITSTNVPTISTSTTDTVIASSHSDIFCGTLTPSASNAFVSGRVFDSEGRSVYNATLQLIDGAGQTRVVVTSPFGYYIFEDVPAGENYVLQVNHKRYGSQSTIVNLVDNIADLDFVLTNPPSKSSTLFEKLR